MAKKKKDSKGTGFAAKMRNPGATSKKNENTTQNPPSEGKIWLIAGFSLFVLFLIAYSTCATAWENAPPVSYSSRDDRSEEEMRQREIRKKSKKR